MDLVYELKIPIITHNGDNFDWPIIENSPMRGGTGYFMDDLTTEAEKWGQIFRNAKSLMHLTITGGEPFIRKDFAINHLYAIYFKLRATDFKIPLCIQGFFSMASDINLPRNHESEK